MSNSRLVWGWILIVLGIVWTGVCFFTTFFMLIYSVPLIVIGIFVLFNKKEDKIETRKDLKEKEYTK